MLELAALPPVVAFTGAAGSGKSTAAQYLIEQHGYVRVRFAGPLKDMLRAIGLGEDEIEGPLKERPCALLGGKSPRYAMQTLGTEWGRRCITQNFWIGLWEAAAIGVLNEGGRVVVDDCRFGNEAEVVRKHGGDVIRVEGRGGIAGKHVSETGCSFDWLLQNVGSKEELFEAIDAVLQWERAA